MDALLAWRAPPLCPPGSDLLRGMEVNSVGVRLQLLERELFAESVGQVDLDVGKYEDSQCGKVSSE